MTETLVVSASPLLAATGAVGVSGRPARAGLTSLGLIATSFALIELTGGQVSAHLHLFAVLVFVALYQQWGPLL